MEEIILQRTNCSHEEAKQIIEDLNSLRPELIPHFKAWLKDETYTSETLYEGYSIKSLEDDYGMLFTGAILTLNWLINEPEEAKKALAYGIR